MATIGLVVFALLDLVLAWFALRTTHAAANPVTSQTATASGNSASASASGEAAVQGSATAKATAVAKSGDGKVIVVSLSDQRAWRAVSRSAACTSGAPRATVTATTDGGSSWQPVDVPLVTVSGLSFVNGSIVASGMGTDCKAAAYAFTSTSAPTATRSTPSWVVDPADAKRLLVAGTPASAQPCGGAVLDLAADSSTDATVLCDDGSIRRSQDGGASWVRRGTVQGAVAIATDTAISNHVYVVSPASCGLTVTQLGSTPGACPPGADGMAAPADLTIVNGVGWLVTADKSATLQIAAQ